MPTEGGSLQLAPLFYEIEQSPTPVTNRQGVVKRRLPASSPCDLFIGVQKPENIRLFSVRFRADALPAKYELPEFKSLDIQIQSETEEGSERLRVTLRAPQPEWNDMFTSLAEDIMRVVGIDAEEENAALSFQRRLTQWQKLLQRTGASGLTQEQQQGLFGELWCLREWVLPYITREKALEAWTGPEGAAKDFQFARGIAVEVKTILAKEPQILTISSEKQLDETGLNALYLLHLSVDKLQGAGETLPRIVESLRQISALDPLAALLLEDKLLSRGYLDVHAFRYNNSGYSLRSVKCYWVHDDFPRIVERNLPGGVGKIQYEISAAACQLFVIDVADFTGQLRRKS